LFKDKLILVGVPLSPSFQADARVVGMLEAWQNYGNVITYYPSSGAAELGQDMIVKFAQHMKPRPTHILFVDYDVVPRPNTLKRLVEHNRDIISGVYPISRKCKIEWCVSKEDPFKAVQIDELPNNPFKAKTIANGIMLVKTEVFDRLKWPYWRSEFQVGDLLTGADIYFCKKAREAGYDLWVDPKIKCSHIKTIDLLGIVKNYLKG
jgi:GT2 family glycosyltransferase